MVFARLRSRFPVPHRRRVRASQQVEEAFARFLPCLELVEQAKESLAAAAPGGRALGIPLAEALARFEGGLKEAGQAVSAWRTAGAEEAWQLCAAALQESSRRAEALRLGEAPTGYDQLYTVLADLMEPLEAFAFALSRFHELGV
jgi:hypothetical protein